MANQHIVQRLAGIQDILKGVHAAGATLSSASRGEERRAFIDQFLSKVLPPQYRFGKGDITDQNGRRSGELDVVVEYPWLPSLPVVGEAGPRLYLAEGIVAVIEVKSDLSKQWQQVLKTAKQLEPLRRHYGGGMTAGWELTDHVPIFAAGFKGWQAISVLEDRLVDGPIDGILVIDPGLFVSSQHFLSMRCEGPWSLWGLISCVHLAASVLSSRAIDVPLDYAPSTVQSEKNNSPT